MTNGDATAKTARSWIALAITLTVGTIAMLPSILTPFVLDDYMQRAMVRGTYPVHRGIFALYDFIGDDDRAILMARGVIPWWSDPRLTIRFLRPLSSALLWIDHKLFDLNALPFHLHSLLWWAAAVLAARMLYARVFSPRVTAIATASFAFAPCHAIAVGWIANREVLVSLAFGIPALAAYAEWREERRARYAMLAAGLFTIALASGEYAVCLLGYVLVIEIVTRGDSLVRRVTGALPIALPACAYLAAHWARGYGTLGSGFYRDPFGDPGAFIHTAPVRFVILMTDAWISIDSEDNVPLLPHWFLFTLIALALAIAWLVLRRALGPLDERARRTAIWLGGGSMIALLPVLSAAPSMRLVGVAMIGTGALAGIVIDHAWFPPDLTKRDRSRTAELTTTIALLIGFTQLVHAPAMGWLAARKLGGSARDFARRSSEIRDRIGDSRVAQVVVLRASSAQTSLQGPFAVEPRDSRPPAQWRVLSWTAHVLVLRTDDHTLELIAPKQKSIYPVGPDDLFRRTEDHLRVGDVADMPGMHAEVLEIGDVGGPRRVRFTFDRPLEDASLTWLVEDSTGFHTVLAPKIGFGTTLDY